MAVAVMRIVMCLCFVITAVITTITTHNARMLLRSCPMRRMLSVIRGVPKPKTHIVHGASLSIASTASYELGQASIHQQEAVFLMAHGR